MREIALQTPRNMEDLLQTLEQRVSLESHAEDRSEASCPSAACGGSHAGAGEYPNEAMTHGKSGLAQAFVSLETGAHDAEHFCWHDI